MHADIKEFRGEHRWLSNFWTIPGGITYNRRAAAGTSVTAGLHAPTTEHLYQALKCVRLEDAQWILESPDAGTAKYRGGLMQKEHPEHLRPNWDQIKLRIMGELTALKFQEPGLRRQLINTGGALIIEGNRWHDVFWGVCQCGKKCDQHEPEGQNHLGRILMVQRALLIAEETFAAGDPLTTQIPHN